MFEEFRRLYCFIDSLGLNLKKILCLRSLPRYFSDRARFKKAGGRITADFPILSDFSDTAGTASGHYFHQDLLVAEQIFRANPERHLDVGSRIDGFVAHVASFRQIEVLDIRPLPDCGHPNIHFRQCDLMQLDASLVGACESISCLHALEHFGLGRYGDKIDPDGHRKGFENLVRMLKPGGTLYLSFPIGRRAIQFNAHRVFAPSDVLEWAALRLTLTRFDYVDDAGNLHSNQSVADSPDMHFGCGIYTFTKAILPHSDLPITR